MRRPITAESLAKSRPHVHKPALRSFSPVTYAEDGDFSQRSTETCECGCRRIVELKNNRRIPGSWT